MRVPLLMTATVNPRGMVGANFSVEERATQYAEAIRFYLTLDEADVVFAENSDSIDAVRELLSDDIAAQVEWVDVSADEYDQTRGKGYNETILIRRAIGQSQKIRLAGCFFKVTGRLKAHNIGRLIAETEGMQFVADCKDHRLYEWLRMPINGHVGECRYWFATTEFFLKTMLPYGARMNDYDVPLANGAIQPPYLAEDAMLAVCRIARKQPHCRDRFRTQARISGRGGHDLGKGMGFFYSTDNDSLALRFKCGLRQILRWTMPWWRV
ncbi:MAG: hypothetical protein K6E73_05300 [Bacteroidales bacterium]|nr:hypothetical protein [Bacteroidales bacterium]